MLRNAPLIILFFLSRFSLIWLIIEDELKDGRNK